MPLSVAEQIGSSPSLKWVAVAIGFHIANAFLGAYMGFFRKGPGLLRIHGVLYLAVLLCLAFFLVLNAIHAGNSIWEYLICAYFITVVPVSKRWDVVLHAFFSIVGLLLLPVLVLLNIAFG
ncbi:MAG: hypothetical protein HY580_02140 [Nitrospinae bacterium]|nr:hypothetical protein [Nitrospinota bacterium]